MERAIREVNGSLLVAIPRELADRHGWRRGDKVNFLDTGTSVQLVRPATAGRSVYTVGYEGRTTTEFGKVLQNSGIQQLIDVREKPISRKPGFAKKSLQEKLDALGIQYLHLGELGSPSAVRQEYQDAGDFVRFARKYETHLAHQTQALVILEALVQARTSAVMCFEKDWSACHRSILCKHLEKKGFKSFHL